MADGPGTPAAHPAGVALVSVDAGLAELAAANLWSMTEADLLDLREKIEATQARLASRVLAITREVDGRGAAVATGASSTAAWLRGRLQMHPGAAKAEVTVAQDLDGDLAATGARLAARAISREQAHAVPARCTACPAPCRTRRAGPGKAFLLEQATTFDPAALHRLGRHLALTLDPERGLALEREEARQHDRQEFTLVHGIDGAGIPRGFFTRSRARCCRPRSTRCPPPARPRTAPPTPGLPRSAAPKDCSR